MRMNNGKRLRSKTIVTFKYNIIILIIYHNSKIIQHDTC